MSTLHAMFMLDEKSYDVYQTSCQSLGRIPLEFEDIKRFYVVTDFEKDGMFAYMTPHRFGQAYKHIHLPEHMYRFNPIQKV